jgi:3',5'-cyclic AMP phosphodiesterase CpdA
MLQLIRAVLLVAPIAASASSALPIPALRGRVFVDANGNGVQDRGERGIAGAAVSNQSDVVLTDSVGAFSIERGRTGVVFVSTPDGFQVLGSFWHAVTDTTTVVDFALRKSATPASFTFVHASDTHIAPDVVGRTQRLRQLADSLAPAFVLITGDLVRDALRVGEAEATSYYTLFGTEANAFRSPVFTVPGNHENFGIETTKSGVSPTHPLFGRAMYRRYRGPDYYSFTMGGVHFVGLNTVDIDDQWYYGHVDSAQVAWLQRDLALVPPTMPVVTFNHIPFVTSFDMLGGYRDQPPAPTLITVQGKTSFRHTVSNARAILALLRTRQHVLALGGHMHVGEHIQFVTDGVATRFEVAPAIIGATPTEGFSFTSGITVYRVTNGVVDAGRFIPLGIVPGGAH